MISRLLEKQDYHLHVNVKELEGPVHPERNAQFERIREQRAQHTLTGQPCISVGTKKKELCFTRAQVALF